MANLTNQSTIKRKLIVAHFLKSRKTWRPRSTPLLVPHNITPITLALLTLAYCQHFTFYSQKFSPLIYPDSHLPAQSTKPTTPNRPGASEITLKGTSHSLSQSLQKTPNPTTPYYTTNTTTKQAQQDHQYQNLGIAPGTHLFGHAQSPPQNTVMPSLNNTIAHCSNRLYKENCILKPHTTITTHTPITKTTQHLPNPKIRLGKSEHNQSKNAKRNRRRNTNHASNATATTQRIPSLQLYSSQPNQQTHALKARPHPNIHKPRGATPTVSFFLVEARMLTYGGQSSRACLIFLFK